MRASILTISCLALDIPTNQFGKAQLLTEAPLARISGAQGTPFFLSLWCLLILVRCEGENILNYIIPCS